MMTLENSFMPSNNDGFTNVVTLGEPQVKNLNFYRPAVTCEVNSKIWHTFGVKKPPFSENFQICTYICSFHQTIHHEAKKSHAYSETLVKF